MKHSLVLLALAFFFLAADAAEATGPHQRPVLDIRVYRTQDALVIRNRQVPVSDCTIRINGDYFWFKARLARVVTYFEYTGFATQEGDIFDAASAPIERVVVQCLRPSLRIRSFRWLFEQNS